VKPRAGKFKLEFACVLIQTMAGPVRAIVIAVADIPGNPGYVVAALATEDGHIMQRTISRQMFEAGQRNGVTMVEARDEKGPLLIVPTGGMNGGKWAP